MIGTLVATSTAQASRPPTRSEEFVIETAFQNAHKRDEGIHLSSIREIRVSAIDDRWVAVLYRKAKRPSKKLSRDLFRRKGEKYKYKRKAPSPIAADLKRPAEPYLVDIRYRGSGTFSYDYSYDDGGSTQATHFATDFGFDFVWRGVELYDDHYPGGDDTPDSASAQGTWSYSQADNFSGCTDSGALQPQPEFGGSVLVERGAKGEVQVIFEDPTFTAPTGCTPYDLWRYVPILRPDEDEFLTLHGVPTFLTEPIEHSLSITDCAQGLDPATESCALSYSATITITPP